MHGPSGCSGVQAVPKASHACGRSTPRRTSPQWQSGCSPASEGSALRRLQRPAQDLPAAAGRMLRSLGHGQAEALHRVKLGKLRPQL